MIPITDHAGRTRIILNDYYKILNRTAGFEDTLYRIAKSANEELRGCWLTMNYSCTESFRDLRNLEHVLEMIPDAKKHYQRHRSGSMIIWSIVFYILPAVEEIENFSMKTKLYV